MDKEKTQILVLVEGGRIDVNLMRHLLTVYGISQNHEIVSYNTNIYELYNHMFRDEDPNTIDFLQLLKEHEKDPAKKPIFDRYYSDILLIFDLDPQDPQFSPDKIKEMAAFFVESSDMGKLYLNYPMVEAFYHMRAIPDKDYESYAASMRELRDKAYKARVQRENRDHDYRKFAINREECSIVIRQNILKVIILSIPDSKLLLVVVEGKELVRGVEVFVIFAVTGLDFAVVPWCERLNEFVLNTKPLKRYLEKSLFVGTL